MNRLGILTLTAAIAVCASCNRYQQPTAAPAAPATPAAPGTPTTSATPTTPAAPGTPATPSTGAQGEIADFPNYPGASQVKFSQGTSTMSGVREVELELQTADTVDAVKAYYQPLIQQGGWAIAKVEERPGKIEWDLTKGTSAVELDIDQKMVGGTSIKIERKDR